MEIRIASAILASPRPLIQKLPLSQLNSPPQTISVRLDKLRFLVEELVLAAALASHATDSDMARMLSRHVAIRIPAFIEHARRLRNSLAASPASAKFKGTVNAFADAFSEYLALTRHKLGAHVQDIDFIERTDIWASIDASKIEYFMQGARELWDSLGELGVPGHQPFATPAALASPAAASVLDYLARDVEIPVTFGTDALAFARANSQTLFNSTPVHQRAGQLALLRRWIRAERELFALFKPHISIARILKARILTDIVSFHDCLITRPVPAGAPQQMDGLDALIVAAGKSPTAIQAFVASNRDDTTIDPIRKVRDRVGGHLEIDPAVPLSTLLAQLDSFDLAGAERHYARLEAAFIQTCRQVEFLKTHLMDGHEVGGMLANPAKVAPFDRSRPDIIVGATTAPTYAQAEMQEQLERWEGGASPFAAAVLDYFRDAFSHAPLATPRERVEEFGSGKRFHRLAIRTSHLFLRDALLAADGEQEEGILALAANCPGFPLELADILAEYHSASGRPPSAALLQALGILTPWWLEDARAIVEGALVSATGPDRLLARAVLLRIYLREEGLARMNGRPSHIGWPLVEAKITSDIPVAEDVAAPIVLASAFLGKDTGIFIRKFDTEYRAFADAALVAARARLGGTLDPARDAALQDLLYSGQLAQAVLCIVTTKPKGQAAATKQTLLQAFAFGLIETGRSTEEGAAVAECLLLCNATEAALDVFDRLSRHEPGNVEPALRVVEVLAGIEGMAGYCRTRIEQIRNHFRLDAANVARLQAVESQLAPR
ncbi:hypothetical protein [Sphingopyxis sp. SCN 67-31]|uniref:hypothetical protein n=1 Tax=Sphingopyxis sp. SCN 67-31 TaxID=1660142 RepID=UPI00086E2E21|nr:hypothetical protein [Sphingopyxis sp. SCN 67-31]ODU27522.1 MAG: hypothetical protein ABS88_16425 [Sphingopyxis sp. SCN 67-31]